MLAGNEYARVARQRIAGAYRRLLDWCGDFHDARRIADIETINRFNGAKFHGSEQFAR
jgi:hypothetical protein